MLCGLWPAFSRPTASAIEKQPDKAAPMSSSGFDCGSPSKRDLTENRASPACAGRMTPLPSLKPPVHSALPLLMPMVSSEVERERATCELGTRDATRSSDVDGRARLGRH